MTFLKKIKRTGFIYSFAIVFNRLVPDWLFRFRRYVIFELSLESVSNDLAISENQSCQVRWCKTELDFKSLEEVSLFNRSDSTGELTGCIAEQEGKVAGGFWSAESQFDEKELGIRVMLQQNQAWLFSARVVPECRKQGVYALIIKKMLADLVGDGKTRFLVGVNPDNIRSHQIHRRLSNAKRGTVIAGRILKTSFCWSRGDINNNRVVSWNSRESPVEIRIR